MKLRLGVVGLGTQWENRHRPALRTLSDRFEVRAICDPVALRAEQAAADFGATAVDGFRALASRDDVDAVLLLSSQWYGALPILAACDSGKAVYCSETLDWDKELAEKIRERVQASGIAFMAEMPLRYSPATVRLKELIATSLGKPRLVFCHSRISRGKDGKPNRSPVKALMESVDWCRYAVGSEPTSVVSVGHKGGADGERDYEMMSLDFSPLDDPGAGPIAQISCGQYIPAQWPEAITFRPPANLQVACDKGIAFLDLPSHIIWFDDAGRHQDLLESERPVGELLLVHFYRAVTSLVRNTSGLHDAYQALRVILAARQSQVEGKRLLLQ